MKACEKIDLMVSRSVAWSGGTEAADWETQSAAQTDSATAAWRVRRKVGWMDACWTAQSVGMLAEQSVTKMAEMRAARWGDWWPGKMGVYSAASKAGEKAVLWGSGQAAEKETYSRAVW